MNRSRSGSFAEAQTLTLNIQPFTDQDILVRLYATPTEIVDIVKKEVQGR